MKQQNPKKKTPPDTKVDKNSSSKQTAAKVKKNLSDTESPGKKIISAKNDVRQIRSVVKDFQKRAGKLVDRYGFIAHPLLFALFPLMSFYGSNASEIKSGDFNIWTFLVLNLIVAAIAWVVSLVLIRNIHKASIITIAFLIVFFTLGRIHGSIVNVQIDLPGIIIGPNKILLAFSVILVGLAWFWAWKLSKESVTKVNSTLTLIASVLVASTLFSIIPSLLSGRSATSATNGRDQAEFVAQKEGQAKPDVYYIVLDGYARADFLKDNFNLDNSSFLDALRKRGFYVAEKANSNYTHTHFSIPSTLNMKYLNYLTKEMGEESEDRKPLKELFDNNVAVRTFKSLGYKYVLIGSQWGWAENSSLSDIKVESKNDADSKILNIKLDEFALVYLQTTALKPWISTDIRGNLLAKILGAFEKTEEVPALKEPTMTLSHILSPHPPYLFDRNGPVSGHTDLELLNDGFSNRGKFADQTVYANKLALKMIDKIIQESDEPPIIILASDHGPASGLSHNDFIQTDPAKFDEAGIKERLGILNAYYFPDKNYEKLYPSITPVNSFRIVLSQYFGQNLKLLPDKSYFSDNSANEYRMFDVTDMLAKPGTD